MKELVKELMNTSSCCDEVKDVCKKYLEKVDTKDAKKALKTLVHVAKESVTSLDELIPFLESDMGKKIFGEEKCKEMLKHSLKEKEKGEKYCDCEACKLARKVIKKASLVTKNKH